MHGNYVKKVDFGLFARAAVCHETRMVRLQKIRYSGILALREDRERGFELDHSWQIHSSEFALRQAKG